MMELTESMLKHLAITVNGSYKVQYGDTVLDFEKPFEIITMTDALKKYSDIDFSKIATDDEAKALAKSKNIAYEERHKKGDILSLLFEEFAEKNLVQPTFVIEHPIEISPLTKEIPDKKGYVERFELYIMGREIANAYSELNDPDDQINRFKAQEALRAAGDDEANEMDEDFINALNIGMPPTGGIGYGIDRIAMLFTNQESIRDVLYFPTLKSLE